MCRKEKVSLYATTIWIIKDWNWVSFDILISNDCYKIRWWMMKDYKEQKCITICYNDEVIIGWESKFYVISINDKLLCSTMIRHDSLLLVIVMIDFKGIITIGYSDMIFGDQRKRFHAIENIDISLFVIEIV